MTAYWLVSGYSLRAWRAMAWLAGLTALFAVAFHLVGFAVPPRPVSYWTSLLYAVRASLSLTDNAVQLTAWDHCCRRPAPDWPVLLGLALRGRVKREATRFDRRRLIVIPRKVGDAIPRYSILTNSERHAQSSSKPGITAPNGGSLRGPYQGVGHAASPFPISEVTPPGHSQTLDRPKSVTVTAG